jgi:peptide/nickel transport system permease protein
LVATATFALIALAPGDAASLPTDTRIPPHIRERWRHDLGLDRPWPERYARWLSNAVSGELGTSWQQRRRVTELLAEAIPNTALLASLGLLIEVAGGVALALAQIRRPHGRADRAITVVTLTAYALPTFGVSLLLVQVLAFWLPLLPPSHMHSPAGEGLTGLPRLLDLLPHLVLPVLAIGVTGAGAVSRYLRGSLIDEQAEHYVLAARARGCTQRRAILAHALPNASLPLITMVGMSLPFVVSGSLVVEVVFAWPGMGQLMYAAALGRDVPVLMGGALVATAAVVLGNWLADIAYAIVDPRVRV